MNKKGIPKLSIVILNYNTADYLTACVRSILRHLDKSYLLSRLVIVDNASSDGSFVKAKKYLKRINKPDNLGKIIFLENNRNLGFSGGNNVGVRVLNRQNSDYVLFLNPDTLVSAGSLEKAVFFMEKNPHVGACTAKLKLASGQLDEACHRGFPTPWRAFCFFSGLIKLFPHQPFFSGYTLGHLLRLHQPHEIDSCSGAFLMVRFDLGQQLKWWDEKFFWYGEDLDFCFRIKKAGAAVYFLPSAQVIHYRGISSGIKKHTQKLATASKKTKANAALASVEAMRIFYRKHYGKRYPFLIRVLIFSGIWFLEKYRLLKARWTS